MGHRSEHRAAAGLLSSHDVGAPALIGRVVRLVRVQAGVVVMVGLLDALLDGVMNTALTSTNALGDRVVPSTGLVAVTLTLHLLGAAVVLVAAWVLARFLRRAHRWARATVLVLAAARGIGLVTGVTASAVYLVSGPSLLVPVAPHWWGVLGSAVSAALFVRMLVDLYGPELSVRFAGRSRPATS